MEWHGYTIVLASYMINIGMGKEQRTLVFCLATAFIHVDSYCLRDGNQTMHAHDLRRRLDQRCGFNVFSADSLASSSKCPRMPGSMPPPTALDDRWPCLLQELILRERKKSSWNRYYSKVTDFIDMKFPGRASVGVVEGNSGERPVRVVEIGTAWGGNADSILFTLPGVELFAVDPLIADYDERDGQSKIMHNLARVKKMSKEDLSQAWASGLAAHALHRHGCRYQMFHMKSTEASQYFEDESIDVIFVDGLHSYEGVKDDLHAWWPKINKAHGIMLFNDYEKEEAFPGVRKAVDEFMAAQGLRARIAPDRAPPGPQNAYVLLGHRMDF